MREYERMKTFFSLITLGAALLLFTGNSGAQTAPVPPPVAPTPRSMADLEKLAAPIALYPDPLIATILPASVYPLEIVQAARFVSDPNNLPNLDAQPWDDNVKAVARIPEVIKKMNDDLTWTMALGEAFLAQSSELMDAIQDLRGQARTVGTLQTTPQQVVVVTNTIVERTYEQSVVYVTNTIVQIVPANPQVVYVPYYNPVVVYAPPPGPPPVVTFAVGVSVGFIMANNCNWYYGGCYRGYYPPPPPRYPPPYYPPPRYPPRPPPGYRPPPPGSPPGYRPPPPPGYRPYAAPVGASQPWTPNPSRLSSSGTPAAVATTRTAEARGWGSGNTFTGTSPGAANRPATMPGNAPGNAATRPATGFGNASNAGTQPAAGNGFNRPAQGNNYQASPPRAPATANNVANNGANTRPAPGGAQTQPGSTRPNSPGSAFGGANGNSNPRGASNRGAASRGGGGGSRRGN